MQVLDTTSGAVIGRTGKPTWTKGHAAGAREAVSLNRNYCLQKDTGRALIEDTPEQQQRRML